MWRVTINTAKPVGFIMMCLVSNPLYCQWLHNVLYYMYYIIQVHKYPMSSNKGSLSPVVKMSSQIMHRCCEQHVKVTVWTRHTVLVLLFEQTKVSSCAKNGSKNVMLQRIAVFFGFSPFEF